ncbi:centrosomal protein of 152 kDa-like isoform X2 [Ostrea edulis]|uniref:centrosomal protein of 152 kDa-like isoform X2 n=1 Tax=Ostrea edulis TaxID=37623 RepID=UPI0024AFA57E|nr:centrosomal protein of 152 kDa-like isoform X2 [Ostrea edulis]XP_056002418.1 centrosomal protein of 152 kDa-like isoform X2 [Ostrea edulis]
MSTDRSPLNTGLSMMNFDGLDLQSQQEKELQRENEQQQNELKALLKDAFDDLIDEDDEFSVTSDEGGDSRNHSLHFKSKDETEPIVEEDEEPSGLLFARNRRTYPLPTSTPLGGLPTIAQSPYGSMSSLRQSQDSLRASQEQLRSSQEGVLRRSQEGLLESDGYHSNSEQSSTKSSNHHHRPQHHRHQFHQVPDWTGQDVFSHHGQPIVYDPTHHGNQYLPHHANHEDPHYRYGEFPERQEAEGGADEPPTDIRHLPGHYHYQHLHHYTGYYRDLPEEEDHPRADNPYMPYTQPPHSQAYPHSLQSDQGYVTNATSVSHGHPVHPTPISTGHPVHSSQEYPVHDAPEKDFRGDYQVTYKRRDDHEESESEEEVPEVKEKRPKLEEGHESTGSVGAFDNRQLAQLQILYKARGSKLEEMTRDFEHYKQETSREIRILKHQISLTKGEKEGTTTSLQQSQDLLIEAKTANAQLRGKLQATENQVEALHKGKEEAVKSLQTAESTIETLNQQLAEMGASDSLSRARVEHERVLAGVQQRHDKEVKVLKEKIEDLTGKLNDSNAENTTLRQKLNESYKEAENSQISRADTINRLTRSLEDSQKQCRMLLESASSHEASQLKVQLKQCTSSKKIADDMILSYQDEIKELKEQLNMFEAASCLGVLSQETTRDTIHDDSMMDLGIKRTIDFDETLEPVKFSSGQKGAESHDLVANLKIELERCLLSNKEKRIQVNKLQEELRTCKKDLEEFRMRCERAEKSESDLKSKLQEWEELVRSDDKVSAVEARLQKDIKNLKREKEILSEDIEDLKKRLEEVAFSEEKLSEINQQLTQQMSQMVREYDQDKREALDRCQRACKSVHETAKEQLTLHLTEEYTADKASLITKYERECTQLRNELNSAMREVDQVKELYVKVCSDKDVLEEKLREENEAVVSQKLQELKEELKTEKELAMEKVKVEMTADEEKIRSEVTESLQKKMGEDNQKLLETKVAMCKMEWFEEQRATKQAAVDNAIKLNTAEWKAKLETEVETQVEARLQEAQTEWLTQRKEIFDSQLTQEREKWKKSSENELQQKVEEEREKWKKTLENELQKNVEEERERWKKTAEKEFQQKVEDEREKWKKTAENEFLQKVEEEKEKWKTTLENEVKQKIEEEKNTWEKETERILQEKLAVERETLRGELEKENQIKVSDRRDLWEKESQEKLEREKSVWEKQAEERLMSEKRAWEKTATEKLTSEKDAWDRDVEERFREERAEWGKVSEVEIQRKVTEAIEKCQRETEKEMRRAVEKERSKVTAKTELDKELKKEKEKWQRKWEVELQERIQKERKDWEEKTEIDILQRIQTEKQNWNDAKDKEIEEKVEKEQKNWEQSLELQTQERIETEVEGRISQEKTQWKAAADRKMTEEIQAALEQARREWEDSHEENVQKIRDGMEESIQERVAAEVSLAVDESKRLWQKEHDAEMLANNSSFEISQSVLKEEIETLKKDLESLTIQLKSREEKFRREKSELIRQKDVERKRAVEEVQDQCEKDYQQFTSDHHDTLTLALKTARDQHNKEKMELERRHAEEIKKHQFKENQMKEAFKTATSDKTTGHPSEEDEKYQRERELWEKENYRLKQEVMERDDLLEKADRHLAQEVDRLRSELEIAYQNRLDAEKLNLKREFKEGHQSDESDRAKLEAKLMDLKHEKERFRTELSKVTEENKKVIDEIHKVTDESYKVKCQVHRLGEENQRLKEELKSTKEQGFDESRRYVKEIQELRGKLDNQEQGVEVQKLKAECEKLRSENDGISTIRLESERLKTKWQEILSEKSDLETKFSRLESRLQQSENEKQEMVENYGILKSQLDKVASEKVLFSENIKNLEMAYKKDLAQQKQKQDESQARLARSEKMLYDIKHYYKNEIDKVKKSLEKDNTIAMESMKNKMREMAKAHNSAMSSLTRQYKEEISEMKGHSTEKSCSDTEVQTDSEDLSDDSMFELRDQYLDTVNKIKDDVMKHITDTNMRAAETVRQEMQKERNTTLAQLKKIYMENVRKVLHNEIIGANIEAKLADIEEALDAISFDKSSRSSSRSTTPRSDISAPIAGQGHLESKTEYGVKVQGHRDMNPGLGKSMSDYRQSDYHTKHNGYSVSKSYQDIRVAPISRSNDYMSMARSQDYSSEKSRPRSAGDGSARKTETDLGNRASYKMNSDLHLEITANGSPSSHVYQSFPQQRSLKQPAERLESRYPRERNRSSRVPRDRSISKEVTFSKDCKRSSPERMEYGRLHANITTRKLSPRDHSTSNENSDQEYNSPRTFKLGQFNGVDLLPSKYVVPSLRDQNSNKFEAVDPHPVERKSKLQQEDVISPVSPLNHSALYKAKSESELSMEQKNSSLGGSYKYLPLREALGKPSDRTDSPKGSSVSQEDLRFSSMQAMSFDEF